MGAGPYDLRITDVFGQVLDVGSVPLMITTEISLGTQFPVHLPTGVTGNGGDRGHRQQLLECHLVANRQPDHRQRR